MGPARCSGAPGARASRLALERTLARTWLLQIDSVNVFARAHHLPVFTRTGTWDPAVLDIASRPGPQRRRHLASPPRHPARKRLGVAAHPTQWAVEYLFRSGALDCVGRTIQFQRLYLPADHPVPPIPEASPHAWPQSPEQAERAYSSQEALPLAEEEAVRGLAALAARALGWPIRRRSRTASGCGSDRCARRWPISSRPGSSRR